MTTDYEILRVKNKIPRPILIFFGVVMVILIALIITTYDNKHQMSELKKLKNDISGLKTNLTLIQQNQEEFEKNFIFPSMEESSLISYWPLDDNSTEDSEWGNDGVNNGAEYISDGKFGGAYYFDGDSYINFGHDDTLNFETEDFTISFWGKANYKAGSSFINKGNFFSVGAGYSFSYATDPQKLYFIISDGTRNAELISELGSIAEWTHIVGLRRGSMIELWINGKLSSKKEVETIDIKTDADLMAGMNFHKTYLVGSIDEVKIWNRALSPREIKYLAIK